MRAKHYLPLVTTLFAISVYADQLPTKDGLDALAKPHYSPYAGRNFPTKVLWGDTHLHTAVSVDAGTMCRIGQEDAYRFARGEEISTPHGLRAKLSRPLDFLVISDHAEMYGLMPQLLSGDPEILSTEVGKRWYEELQSGDTERIFATAMEIVASLSTDVRLNGFRSRSSSNCRWQNAAPSLCSARRLK